jgi:hypothetical protein
MTEAEWLACKYPGSMLEFHRTRRPRKRRLFAVACCYWMWDLLADERCQRALRAAEEMADQADHTEQWDPWNQMQDVLTEFDERAGELGASDAPVERMREALEAVCEVTHPNILNVAEQVARRAARAVRAHQPDDFFAGDRAQADLLREIFGNPFRGVRFLPSWRTDTALLLARQMYDSREFSAMPILADALQDAGCDSDAVLSHCREPGTHVRGCWACDLVLGKE